MSFSSQQQNNKIPEINFLISLQPMLFIIKMAGLVPWTPRTCWKTNISRATQILQCIIIIVKLYMMFFYEADNDADEELLNREVNTDDILNNFLYIIVVCNCSSRGSKIIKIFDMLANVDKELQDRYYFESRNSIAFSIKFLVWVLVGFIFIFITILTTHARWYITILASVNVCFGIVAYILIILLCTLMRVIALRFAFINNMLRRFADNQHLDLSDRASVATYEDIKFIFRIHNALLDIFAAFNEYAGILCFWSLAHMFYSITTTLFRIFLFLTFSKMEIFEYILLATYQLQQDSLLILIAYSCGQIVREANATSRIISKIYGQTEEMQYLMDKFLAKCIKNRVTFSALGFFNIDESILFKIYSSVTTYLVILIQFKQLQMEEDAM